MGLAALHKFWFRDIELTDQYYAPQVARWFLGSDPRLDDQCREHFAPLLERRDQITIKSPSDLVAKIILLDQIPRNCFRTDARAYDYDGEALRLTLDSLVPEIEQALSFPERLFLYMPLEHAESRELQDLSVRKFQELADQAPASIQTWTALALRKASEHRETIMAFGRFPQRNTRLGRLSTKEEMNYLLR